MSTNNMSTDFTSFVNDSGIFTVVQVKDQTKINNQLKVSKLEDMCNKIISFPLVPACLADPVCAMKNAYAKFLEEKPKAKKDTLQAMLLPIALAATAAKSAAAPAPSALLALASALALPEDECMSESSSSGGKRRRANGSPSVAPTPAASTSAAAAPAVAFTFTATAPAPAAAAPAAAAPAGSFSTCSLSSSLASGRVGRGSVLKNELPVGSNIDAFTIVGYSPTLVCTAVTIHGNPCGRKQAILSNPNGGTFTTGKCSHLSCMKQTPAKREAYLATKRPTLDELSLEISSLTL
jgi:hypothetical protein